MSRGACPTGGTVKIDNRGKRELVRDLMWAMMTNARNDVATYLNLDCRKRPLTGKQEEFLQDVYAEAERRITRVMPKRRALETRVKELEAAIKEALDEPNSMRSFAILDAVMRPKN